MATDRPGPSIRISDILRSGLALIVILGVLGFLAGLALATRSKESSTATTPILVNPLDGNPFYPSTRGEQLINLESEAQAVRSSGVAKKVAGKGRRGSECGRTSSKVSPSRCRSTRRSSRSRTRTPIRPRRKRCHRHSPTRTSSSARNGPSSRSPSSRVSSRRRSTPTRPDCESLATQLAVTPPNSAQATILQESIQGVSSQITTMSVRQSELTGTALDPGQVVVPAKLEPKGSLNTKLLLPVAGLIGGAIAGFVIAILRAQANPTISRREDLDELGVKVLGTWSPVSLERGSGSRPTSKRCVASASHSSPSSEARPFSILFTPVGSTSHHASVVLELGRALSITGLRTIVVDATSRRGPAERSGHGADLGLSEVMSRECR